MSNANGKSPERRCSNCRDPNLPPLHRVNETDMFCARCMAVTRAWDRTMRERWIKAGIIRPSIGAPIVRTKRWAA
jgi:hypothetical protein